MNNKVVELKSELFHYNNVRKLSMRSLKASKNNAVLREMFISQIDKVTKILVDLEKELAELQRKPKKALKK